MLPSAIQENPKHPAVAGNPLILTSDVPFLKCCVTFIPDVCVPQRFCFCLVSAQNVLPKLNLLVLPLSTSHNIHPNTCFCALSNIHSSSRWFFGRRAFMLDYPSTPSHMQWRDRRSYGSVVTCLIIHWRTLNVILVSRLLLIVSRFSPRVDPGSDCGPVNPVRLIDVHHRVPWLFL